MWSLAAKTACSLARGQVVGRRYSRSRHQALPQASGKHSKARRRPNDPTSQQAEGPPARALNPPPTQLHRPPRRPGTGRDQRQRDPTRVNVHTLKQKPPLTRGNAVPEVGLEPHSSPCKHWTPPKTCGIRPSPAPVRPSPKPKVWTLSTPPILPTKGLPQTAAPRIDRARRFFALKNLILLEKSNRGCNRVLPAPVAESRACSTACSASRLSITTSPPFKPFMIPSAHRCMTGSALQTLTAD